MTVFETTLNLTKMDPAYTTVNRTSVYHLDLPDLIYALGSSTLNGEAYDLIDSMVVPSGRIEGTRSAQVPDITPEISLLPTEYIRPNGELYYPRMWTGIQDVQVLHLCREHVQYPLFYGPPGTGKTALCEAAFLDTLVTIVMTADTAERDLVGQFIPNPLFGTEGQPEYVWADGPLLVAMKNGWPLLVDEVGLGDPKVLSVLYGAMDGRREITVNSNPSLGTIKAADGFLVIGATNPNAPGVNLSEALLSRFTVQVEMTTDWNLASTVLKVPEDIVGIAMGMAKEVGTAVDWSPNMRELLAYRDLRKVFGESFAIANLIAIAPEEDRLYIQERLSRLYGDKALAARI